MNKLDEGQVFINNKPLEISDRIDWASFNKTMDENMFQAALDCALKEPVNHKELLHLTKPKQGTISWSGTSAAKLTETITQFNEAAEKLERIAFNIQRKVNEYLNNKVKAYLSENNIDIFDWCKNGQYKQCKSKWECFYKDDLICGVEMINNTSEVELRYY